MKHISVAGKTLTLLFTAAFLVACSGNTKDDEAAAAAAAAEAEAAAAAEAAREAERQAAAEAAEMQRMLEKEAMAVVGLSWVLATVLGALPYYISGTALRFDDSGAPQSVTFVEAMFESQSGFSTTGATVLTQLEDPSIVPHCILFWRSSTHFLGGLGIGARWAGKKADGFDNPLRRPGFP